MKISDLSEDDKFEYTTEKQILIRIRQILYDRKLSGTESNAGELAMLRRKLKDLRNKKDVAENFADGKGPGKPGDSQRHGIPKNATVAQLAKAAKAPGRRGQLARWQINMRRGKKRANEQQLFEADKILTVMDKPIDVLINPGYQRMLAFAKSLSHPVLRALYVPSKDVVIVWAAELGIHYQIAQALVDQLGWDLGPNLKHSMTHHQLIDPNHPQSAILRVELPLVDSTGKIKRDTNIHKRAGDFSIVALPKFYNINWWDRIKRTAPPVTESWSNKYKKSINCDNPQGFSQRAHCAARKLRSAGKRTASKPVKENQDTDLKDKLAQAAQQVDLVSMPTVNGGATPIVELEGRPIVVVNFNGHSIPFYCSTGSGGKTDVPMGHWYPFWGIARDGWFNKGSGDLINKFYNSPRLAMVAEKLNSTLGNLIGRRHLPTAGVTAVAMINQHQQPMNYADARQDPIKYYAGINTQINKLTGNSQPKPNQTSHSVLAV